MKRQVIAMAVAAAVTLTLAPATSDARVRFVPRVVMAPPPTVYLVPGFADVYFYRSGATDVFFAGGMWWTTVGGMWYQAAHWQGPWMMVASRHVPMGLVRLPPDWHRTWQRWDRVPWGHVQAQRHMRPAARQATAYRDRSYQAPTRAANTAPQRANRGQSNRAKAPNQQGNRPAPRR